MKQDEIIQSIYSAIDETNQVLPPHQNLAKAADTALFGEGGKLDSLGLVSLVVSVERKIEDVSGQAISLANEKAMSQKNSPFRNVQSLADYISLVLEENAARK